MTLKLKHPTSEFFIDSCVSAQDMITTDRVACSDVRLGCIISDGFLIPGTCTHFAVVSLTNTHL